MGVFVLTDQQQLVAMKSAQFDTEDEFQSLLEKFPELLSGDAAERDIPQRWLLLSREQSVPAEEGGAGRFSIDHLFVDQDGIPTLVEVKRKNDTRLRREVVGQMLDYAANAFVYWSVEQLRTNFESKYPEDPEEIIRGRLGLEIDQEVFWQNVKTNLQAGRIRLLFVADQIPDELKRVVEFLNVQMNPAEVLALELRRFEGHGLKTIVPVVYGRTEKAIAAKEPRRPWDRDAFFTALKKLKDPKTSQVAENLATWMERNADRIEFGSGVNVCSMTMFVGDGFPCRIWSYGRFVINFQYLMRSAAFKEETKRVELITRLNQIDGVNLAPDVIADRARIRISSLARETRLNEFLAVLDGVVSELKKSDVAQP